MPPIKRKDSKLDSDVISKLLKKGRMEDDDEDVDHIIQGISEEQCLSLEAALVESPNLANIKTMIDDVQEGYFMTPKESLDISLSVQARQAGRGSSSTYDLLHQLVNIKEDMDCHRNYSLLYVSFSFLFLLPCPFSIILLLLFPSPLPL